MKLLQMSGCDAVWLWVKLITLVVAVVKMEAVALAVTSARLKVVSINSSGKLLRKMTLESVYVCVLQWMCNSHKCECESVCICVHYPPMKAVALGLMMPLGRRWKSYSTESTTTVCPALLPPCRERGRWGGANRKTERHETNGGSATLFGWSGRQAE